MIFGSTMKKLKKLEEVDPESVRRANTFFSIPVPAKDTGSSTSAVSGNSKTRLAALPIVRQPGQLTAQAAQLGEVHPAGLAVANQMNPWRLVYVVTLALATLVIIQLLLLTGGTRPGRERS